MLNRAFRCIALSALTGVLSAVAGLAVPAHAQVPSSALADPGMSLPLPAPLDLGGGSLANPGAHRRPQTLAPVSPSSPTKTVLSVSAFFFQGSDPIQSGLRWRIFSDQADVNGNHALVYEGTESKPLVTLDPGGYIVHVTYGLASATRPVVLGTGAESEQIVLNAGAIRFSGTVGDKAIPAKDLNFEVHRTDGSMEQLIAGQIKAGELVRLPAGSYQVTSTYGQANARVVSEVRVEPGKLTDAAVLHKAGRVNLHLVGAKGAAIADATWNILTPGGDAVTENLTEIENVVLAEGEYVAVARYNGQIYQKPFQVHSGKSEKVDLAAN